MAKYECACGAKYKFPDSAIGKKAKCKRCGAVFTLGDDTGPIPLADDASSGGGSLFDDELLAQAKSVPALRAFPEVTSAKSLTPNAQSATATATSARKYGEAILWTILFPASIYNFLSFIAIWIGLAIGGILPCFLSIIVSFWYAAFRFAVIESGAAGEKSLPQVGFSRDMIGDLIHDGFRWLGSWALALAPAVVYSLVQAGVDPAGLQQTASALANGVAGLMPGSGADRKLVTLIAVGLFMWPIMVLVITLGGFGCVYRVDLMLITIARSFPAYLVTLALALAATVAEQFLQDAVASGVGKNAGGGAGAAVGSGLAMYVLFVGISLYCNIVMLRAIGLYYHHFKEKFAWDWG